MVLSLQFDISSSEGFPAVLQSFDSFPRVDVNQWAKVGTR